MATRILQIDDDIINNMSNERIAKKLKLDVVFTSFLDPIEALHYLNTQNQLPDFIILDINMPRINGWEVLQKLNQQLINLPVVMLTSSIDPSDQRKADDEPLVKGFMIKPLTGDMLLKSFEMVGIEPTFKE